MATLISIIESGHVYMLRRSPVLGMVFISTQRHTTWRYVTERHVMLSAVSLSGIDVDPSLIISTPVP